MQTGCLWLGKVPVARGCVRKLLQVGEVLAGKNRCLLLGEVLGFKEMRLLASTRGACIPRRGACALESCLLLRRGASFWERHLLVGKVLTCRRGACVFERC